MKEGWHQKREKLKRICCECGREFECSGKCGSPSRLEDRSYCYCSECVGYHTLYRRSVVCPNYHGKSLIEVFFACYGIRRKDIEERLEAENRRDFLL